MKFLRSFSQFMVVYTILVIDWGAWVRISKSGDGCGDHWPLCHGEVIPLGAEANTWVEFSHRLSTGLFGIFVLAICFLVYKYFPKKSVQRKYALATLIFTLIESLIGAVLVKAGLVGANETVGRTYIMAVHQINSLLLTIFVFLTYKSLDNFKLVAPSWGKALRIAGAFSCVVITGAIAALAGTLYPEQSLSAGLIADFAKESHHLVKLRISHPVLATLFATGFSIYCFMTSSRLEEIDPQKSRAWSVLGLGLLIAMALGYVTLFTLSPTPMKILHLTVAHVLAIFIANIFLQKEKV